MRFLLRVIGFFIMAYAALSVVRGILGVFTPAQRVATGSGHLVKDPVCGTYIPESTAIHAGDYFFCSEECRRKLV